MNEYDFEDLQKELEATQDALQAERAKRKQCQQVADVLGHTLSLVSCELSDSQYDYYEMDPNTCPRMLAAIHVIVLGED